MNKLFLLFFITCISAVCFCYAQPEDTKMSKADKAHPTVLMKTSMGDIIIELYPEKAPITVKNFLQYAQEGFFNHTIFHRVIPNFMVQGGGFTKDMKQKATHAQIQNEADNGLKNERGTLAMARTSDVNSATAQFFINSVNNSFLDFKDKTTRGYGYCVFGKVIDGMAIVDKMGQAKTSTQGAYENVPVTPIEIIDVTILTAK